MRKALMAVLMAATAASVIAPVAAEAQERRIGRGGDQQEQRQERQEQRQERRAERQAAPAGNVEAPQRRIGSPRPQQVESRSQGEAWRGHTDRSDNRADNRTERRGDWANGQNDWRGNRNDRQTGNRDVRIGRPDDRQRQDRGNVRIGTQRDGRWQGRDDRNGRYERHSDRRDVRDWSRSWRNDRRYDWQRYRYQNRNAFHVGRYYAPYRHSYSRFSIGFFLGQPFYSQRYWIDDPWQYRLPPAYAGTRWVRYYDDVLLVDLYTGEVIDVIYDFFW